MKNGSLTWKMVASLFALAVVPSAGAHVMSGHPAPHPHALFHPLLGLDHILAIFAAGLWASQANGYGRWGLPLLFVGATATGGVLGASWLTALSIPGVVALSALALGIAIATFALSRGLFSVGATLMGGFGFIQGQVHGMAFAQSGHVAGSLSGLIFGTALLVAVSAGVGSLVYHPQHRAWVRLGAGTIACFAAILCVV